MKTNIQVADKIFRVIETLVKLNQLCILSVGLDSSYSVIQKGVCQFQGFLLLAATRISLTFAKVGGAQTNSQGSAKSK